MTATDVFNAVVGYYLIVLAVSAGAGVREQLRDPAGAAATTAAAGTTPIAAATPASPSTRARFGALVHGRTLHAAHRFGWATGVGAALGWLAGVEMYRVGRRGAAIAARRAQDWREKHRTAPDPGQVDPDADDEPASNPPGSGAGWLGDHRPPMPPPGPTDPAPSPPAAAAPAAQPPALGGTPAADVDPADAEIVEDPATAAAARRPGRPPLYLVPPPQEYPPIMPAAEIYDLESLINFTDQTATVAGMESEDAAAAAASMIAGAEFAGETATRVGEETASLEAAVAAMAMLRVDAESTAAYHALLEAGQVYRDTTTTFAQQCHDAAYTAGQMSAAAAHYNETAQAALAVLNAHQMPHAEAANATGHSGAHGAFYGVTDTGSQTALAGSGAPQLPAS